jgi:hypothetical protein
VRNYAAFPVVSQTLPAGTGAAGDGGGFGALAGYIFGGNATGAKMEMTTPVLNRVSAEGTSTAMLFPVFEPGPLPDPRPGSAVQRGIAASRIAAARAFSGVATDTAAARAAEELRAALQRDGLTPRSGEAGYTLARYNDPFTPPWARVNEVLIDLQDFPVELS